MKDGGEACLRRFGWGTGEDPSKVFPRECNHLFFFIRRRAVPRFLSDALVFMERDFSL